jgi:hypothetical protein
MFSAKMNFMTSKIPSVPQPPTTPAPQGDDCNPALFDQNGYPQTCGLWYVELPSMYQYVVIEGIEGIHPQSQYTQCRFTDSGAQQTKQCIIYFTDSTYGGSGLDQRTVSVKLSTGVLSRNAIGLMLSNNPSGFGCPQGTYWTGGGDFGEGICLPIRCCGGPCAPSGDASRCGTCRLGNC